MTAPSGESVGTACATAVETAIVGFGWWGRALADAADGTGLRVAGVVDPSAQATAEATRRGLAVWGSVEAALRDDIEALVLCSPPPVHHAQLLEGLRAGRHVFCEKPFCLTARQAREAIALAESRGLVLGVGHERRFEPPVQALVAAVAAGELGEILAVEGNFSQDRFLGLDRDDWRFDPAVSPVGPLSATGVHLLDLAVALLDEPSQVWALTSTRGSDFANGDTLVATIRFASGAGATVTASLATPFLGRVAAIGSRGWVEIVDLAHPERPAGWTVTTHLRGRERHVATTPPASGPAANLAAFVAAIRGRAAYPVPTEDLVRTVAVHDAVERSVRSGTVVTVDLAHADARAMAHGSAHAAGHDVTAT